MRKAHWRYTPIGILACATLLLTSGTASAAPAHPSHPMQDGRTEAASVLDQSGDLFDQPGFAGINVDQTHVVLKWHGAVPAVVARSVNSARQLAPVSVQQVAHSRADLDRASTIIDTWITHHPESHLNGVGIDIAAGRLIVGTDGSPIAQRSYRSLPATGIDTVEKPELRLRVTDSREDPHSPWKAGAHLHVGEWWENFQEECTSGFGVHSTVDNRRYVLIAGHCEDPAQTHQGVWGHDTGGEFVGSFTHRNAQHDDAMIETNPSNKMWDGPLNAGFTKTVVGWDVAAQNESLCTSGAVTGVLCGFIVDQVAWKGDVSDGRGGTLHLIDMTHATRQAGTVQSGDSGGPVFSIVPGTQNVRAAGIISAADGGKVLIFQDFRNVRMDFQVEPQT